MPPSTAGPRRRTRRRSKPTPTSSACCTTAMQPENLAAVRLGIASHNLFDAGLRAGPGGRPRRPWIGCNSKCSKGWPTISGGPCSSSRKNVLLYAPACRKEDFHPRHRLPDPPARRKHRARKLPRGTPSGSLSAATIGTLLEQAFLRIVRRDRPCSDSAAADAGPRQRERSRSRVRSRRLAPSFRQRARHRLSPAAERRVGRAIIALATAIATTCRPDRPLVVAGQRGADGRAIGQCRDPSRPGDVVARYRQATDRDVDAAVACAGGRPGRLAVAVGRPRAARSSASGRRDPAARGT